RVRVDDRALQPERAYAALQLLRGSGRILRCHGGEGGVAVRMLAYGVGDFVVRRASQGSGGGPVEHLHARRRQEEELHVDAACVHVVDAALVQPLDAIDELPCALAAAAEVEAPEA